MIKHFNSEFLTPGKKYRRLSVLLSIHDNASISQHQMAERTHLSSSMVNNYIKELNKEGLITVTGETNRTQRYYLTESGQKELISSLLAYSSEIIQLYGGAKRQLANRLQSMYEEGIRKVALFGAAETAEVVLAAMKETPLLVAAIVDSDRGKQGKAFNGLRISDPGQLIDMDVDAVVITSFGKQEEIDAYLRKFVGNKIKIRKLSDL